MEKQRLHATRPFEQVQLPGRENEKRARRDEDEHSRAAVPPGQDAEGREGDECGCRRDERRPHGQRTEPEGRRRLEPSRRSGPEQDRHRDQERSERLGHHEGLLAREPRVQGEEGQGDERSLPAAPPGREPDEGERQDREEELHAEEILHAGSDPAHCPDEKRVTGRDGGKRISRNEIPGARREVPRLGQEPDAVSRDRRAARKREAREEPRREKQSGRETLLPVTRRHAQSGRRFPRLRPRGRQGVGSSRQKGRPPGHADRITTQGITSPVAGEPVRRCTPGA